MLRRVRTWFRAVLPAEEAAAVFFGLWLLILGAYALADSLGARNAWESRAYMVVLFLYVVAATYGAFRAIYHNPVEFPAYGRWLIDTPWKHPDPLPLGPLQLVWQDVVVIGVLLALFPYGYFDAWYLPVTFLLVYSFGITATLCKVGIYWPAYLAAALAGVFILTVRQPQVALLMALAIYAVIYVGIQQMLAVFPFSQKLRERLRLTSLKQEMESLTGWPVPPLLRERYSWRISHVDAVGLSVSIAWLLYCVLYLSRNRPNGAEMAMILSSYIAILFIAGRCWLYLWGYVPPISLLGRMLTGRLIIPRYDVALVAPLTAALVAIAIPWAIGRYQLPAQQTMPIGCGLVVWLTLVLPPRREDWLYTGAHRVCFRFQATQEESSAARRRAKSFRLLR